MCLCIRSLYIIKTYLIGKTLSDWCDVSCSYKQQEPGCMNSVLRTNSPYVCVIKVCSNGGTTYIIGEIIAKENLNMANLM